MGDDPPPPLLARSVGAAARNLYGFPRAPAREALARSCHRWLSGVRAAPRVLGSPTLWGPSGRARVGSRGLVTLVVSMLLAGCGGLPGTEEEAIALVDAIDGSCSGIHDPIQLPDVFRLSRTWIKVEPTDFVAAEIRRESERQDRVIVDLPAVDFEVIVVHPKHESIVLSSPVAVREDKFRGLETVSSFGGSVYVTVTKQGRDQPSGASWLVWIDSTGGAHFLGDCSPYLWTRTLRLFADDTRWTGTEEELLLRLIHRGPEFDALHEWTW